MTSGSEDIDKYLEILRHIKYVNSAPQDVNHRTFTLTCSELNGRFVSNTFKVQVRENVLWFTRQIIHILSDSHLNDSNLQVIHIVSDSHGEWFMWLVIHIASGDCVEWFILQMIHSVNDSRLSDSDCEWFTLWMILIASHHIGSYSYCEKFILQSISVKYYIGK